MAAHLLAICEAGLADSTTATATEAASPEEEAWWDALLGAEEADDVSGEDEIFVIRETIDSSFTSR